MISTIWLLLFCGIISEHLASSQKSTKVKKNNLKVHINATGDTLVMKFLRPNENLKLEGFVLGYGSNFFSNQYIQWPENGKSYVTEVDAEPRYLIALKPNENSKKTCKDKNPAAKPLQLVIGTLTPTSTFLSWGILINPQIDWSVLNKCPNDRFYTVRYREKNKDWMYQLCPTTEIVIDSLKPSTMYEFGVKDNTENGIWSKLYNHKTIPKSKDNGQIQSTNKISKAILQMASEDTKALIPVTVIKQGFLNLTYFNSQTKTASESTTEKHKATEPPSIPKTTKKPNTEVYKPAPYKLQHSSQRPRTSVGSRINPVSSAPFLPVQPTIMRRRPHATNVTGRPGSVLMPRAPSTARPNRTAVSIKAPIPSSASPEPEDTVEATVFSPTPKSEIDALGKIRTTGPHITYMTKKQEHPCSITESLKYFPTEEATNQEIVSRPMNPPSNLTIVTVEGCPSFVILDWQPPENDTVTEYKIISTENGAPPGKDQSIITTNQTFQTVENLKPNASYQFLVIPTNPLGEGPASNTVEFSTESADPRVSEPVTGGKDAIWTEIKFKSDSYSECKGKQFVKRTWYKKFVGIQLCNSLRYKIYLSDSLLGTFYNIGDQSGFGEDHCQFVDSFLDGRTGQQLSPEQLTTRKGFYRAVRQQPVDFGNIGGNSQIRYVHWYECGIAIPGKW